MLDKKAFQDMRKHMEKFDALREELILQSRKVLKASKVAIYAAHRNDMKAADRELKNAKTIAAKLDRIVKKDVHLNAVGAYHEALEEFAEASCYVYYLKTKKIPTAKQVGVSIEIYLHAISDVVGELVRKAINSSIKGDNKTALEIRDVVAAIYAEMMLFEWRNTPARRKFDAIKYGLEKLEDLALKIKFKK